MRTSINLCARVFGAYTHSIQACPRSVNHLSHDTGARRCLPPPPPHIAFSAFRCVSLPPARRRRSSVLVVFFLFALLSYVFVFSGRHRTFDREPLCLSFSSRRLCCCHHRHVVAAVVIVVATSKKGGKYFNSLIFFGIASIIFPNRIYLIYQHG